MDTNLLLRVRAARGRIDRIERLVRALGEGVDPALAHRLFRSVGDAVRRGVEIAPAALAFRETEPRPHLAALVDVTAARALEICDADIDLKELVAIRDVIESVRVGVRWACLPFDFEARDLPGWRAISNAVRRMDAAIVARLQAESGAQGRSPIAWALLPDADDPANWLARIGYPTLDDAALDQALARHAAACGATRVRRPRRTLAPR